MLHLTLDCTYGGCSDAIFSFVSDEQIGGIDDMGVLIQSEEWSDLGVDVGFALDEYSPHPKSRFNVYVGELHVCWFSQPCVVHLLTVQHLSSFPFCS